MHHKSSKDEDDRENVEDDRSEKSDHDNDAKMMSVDSVESDSETISWKIERFKIPTIYLCQARAMTRTARSNLADSLTCKTEVDDESDQERQGQGEGEDEEKKQNENERDRERERVSQIDRRERDSGNINTRQRMNKIETATETRKQF
jgi:hypothetical protein